MNALAGLANYSDDDEDNELGEEKSQTQTPPQKEINKESIVKEEPPAVVRQHLNATDKARKRKALLTPKPIEGIDNWGIPAEPDTPCDSDRLEKVVHFLSLRSSGHRLNDHLQRNKAFRNPRIYAKLVEFIDLDETGSNFEKEAFDPHGFPKEAYIDGILEQQRKHAEEKAQAQQNRSNISFVQSQQKASPKPQPPSIASSQPPPSPAASKEQSAAMAAALANVAKVKSRLEQQQKRSSTSSSSQWDERERKRAHRE
ncbi:HCNGP-like protein-domain-containing protein [Phascolomyces articulosus]|uniref:HCNGP-like protein-domain-containing protein n=1 Tax=Phascolomyces articulosus TaxID=60185 RepID=A0AAD5JQD9_9FUNG|nr:HCNGP-like protein-domain-containing protein [Phascolomyces articulosus]